MRMPMNLREAATPARNYSLRRAASVAAAVVALWFSGCTVGPNYKRPSVDVPSSYKEPPPQGWKEAAPHDEIAKGNWWEAFGDSQLNDLETQALASSPTLLAAVARVTQARASVRITRADLFPTVNARSIGGARARIRHPAESARVSSAAAFTANTITLPLDVSYEVDLWGRVRRSVESARAQAQASQADYENILLTLKSDVAQNYFSLRYVDVDRGILRDNIELLKKALDLTQVRHSGGVASGLDVSEAETLAGDNGSDVCGAGSAARAIRARAGRSCRQACRGIFGAGKGRWFSSRPRFLRACLPISSSGGRTSREAERLMASANAQIGVARAAFFPSLNLTGSAGYLSDDLLKLFNLSSTVWSVAAGASQPLYAGGRISANLVRARAAYDESVANYRQQVLVAFQEVEDGLSGLRVLEEQEAAQNKAVESSKQDVRHLHLSLQRRARELSRSDRCRAYGARECARIRAIARVAASHHGSIHQSPRRRLAGIEDL